MINQDSFKKAIASSTNKSVDPTKLEKKLNKKLSKADKNGQYNAIKELIGKAEAKVLKEHYGLDKYISPHDMRWLLVNAFNEE